MSLNNLYNAIKNVKIRTAEVEKAGMATVKQKALELAKAQNIALAQACEQIAMLSDKIAELEYQHAQKEAL